MATKRYPGVVRLSENRYQVRISQRDPKTGRRREVRRRIEAPSAAEAARVLASEVRRELVEGPATRVRLADFAGSWLAGRLARGRLKASAAAKIASVVDLHVAPAALGATYVDAIRPVDVDAWLTAQLATGAAAVTVLGRFRVLRSLLRAARALYQLPGDATAGVEPPVYRPDAGNFLTAAELGAVLAAFAERWPQWHPLVSVLAFTALRWGEASALRWEDVDREAGVILIRRGNWKGHVVESTKTGRSRSVPLVPHLAEVLEAHRRGRDTGWMFPTAEGGLHAGSPLVRPFRAALAEAGVTKRVTIHGLRHSANDLMRRVTSEVVARSITGHSTRAMTEHYSHVDAGEKALAVGRVVGLVLGPKGETR